MCPYRRWIRRQAVVSSALLAWLALSAAPATTSPAASTAAPPAASLGQPTHCDTECLGEFRLRLIELHRQTAPVWLL